LGFFGRFFIGVPRQLVVCGGFFERVSSTTVHSRKKTLMPLFCTHSNQRTPVSKRKAAASIQGAVVRSWLLADPKNKNADIESGVGTGVVIKDDGTILTNFHVIAGAKKLRVTFFDGTETDATVVGVQAEKDLAVMKPQKIPDDLDGCYFGLEPTTGSWRCCGCCRLSLWHWSFGVIGCGVWLESTLQIARWQQDAERLDSI
jgi:hypothetical protein